MAKHFCCCLSLKAGAMIMAFLNLLEGGVEAVCGVVFLTEFPRGGLVVWCLVAIVIGLLSIFNGVLLLTAIVQAKERRVLLYLLLSSATLFIVLIYSGVFLFHNVLHIFMFGLSVFMVYGQFCMYSFYEEVSEYNTVSAGVIEISYNGESKSYVNSTVPTDTSVDNTSV